MITNKENFYEEFAKAGNASMLRENALRLESHRITPETEIVHHRFLFTMHGKPCFPCGELVAVTGKKKCGKTFFNSILISLCKCREFMSMRRIDKHFIKVLWIDTEQSEESTQEILVGRIMKMIGPSESLEHITVYNLRSEAWNERLPLIETAVVNSSPDLVIIDGIRDVVDDINDGTMAINVMERIMTLASEKQCCIVCTLHQNKSADDHTLRGALGTELGNKCFEEYECRKDTDHMIFECRQVSTRKYDIQEKLVYKIGEDGIPRSLYDDEVEELRNKSSQKKSSCLNPIYAPGGIIDLRKTFTHVLAPGTELRSGLLCEAIMSLLNMTSKKHCHEQIKRATDVGVISKRTVSGNEVYYSLCLQS